MNIKRLPEPILKGLEGGATLIVPSAQRQAAIRAAWAAIQRSAARTMWETPRVFTFAQYAEMLLTSSWADSYLPDRLLPAGAEWACARELRRDAGGVSEARALLRSIRMLDEWQLPRGRAALGDSPEAQVLADTLSALDTLSQRTGRRPLRQWFDELTRPAGSVLAAGFTVLPALQRRTFERLSFDTLVPESATGGAMHVATADNDEHELDLVAQWCREQLERDPTRRLLIVDANLTERRRLYQRALSQVLTPSVWNVANATAGSSVFAVEGGRPLGEFPLIGHALLSLRLLSGSLTFVEILAWLRQPFLEHGAAAQRVEEFLRAGRQFEFSAPSLAGELERRASDDAAVALLATRLRRAHEALGAARRSPAEWSARCSAALATLGWPGPRTLNSDEQQTVARWQSLLDEYAALGAWLPAQDLAAAVATLADLAAERRFDPASVEAPVTLTDSQDDPIVHYDAIWVAGLDAAQWPAPARPDVFIPLHLQRAAHIPGASAAGQSHIARCSLSAWRASAAQLVCSWARLEGDAHRAPSPLLARATNAVEYRPGARSSSLAARLVGADAIESIADEHGIAWPAGMPVVGGVRPIERQADCAFRAYGELRLGAEALEEPTPGIDARERGMLLHRALELVWRHLHDYFRLKPTSSADRQPMISTAVRDAIAFVFRSGVPADLTAAVERERRRLEDLVESLLARESMRTPFSVEELEVLREVEIAGARFKLRIDRIDNIEGEGFAILDYKSGAAPTRRWDEEPIRGPQLLAYLLGESERPVYALANVAVTAGAAKFSGRAMKKNLLPDIRGCLTGKPEAGAEEAEWEKLQDRWIATVQRLARDYLAGRATVQPANDVCRICDLTTLCRRTELTTNADEAFEGRTDE